MSANGLRVIDNPALYMRACAAYGIALDWHQRGFQPSVATGDLMDRCGLSREHAEQALDYAAEKGWLVKDSPNSAHLVVRKVLR